MSRAFVRESDSGPRQELHQRDDAAQRAGFERKLRQPERAPCVAFQGGEAGIVSIEP
jgi:hypothetical protein